ncbi:hypothetical protein L6164_005641 [Bauhinia variegata]|uniref:Uncharacterized protein n=1 Tax=Bauhinia variegata TaxID=167791 RepID=A0ACB9PR55_BAUVA|nr:hypothetical protein L6164_005641 [Bauhinia variegata]
MARPLPKNSALKLEKQEQRKLSLLDLPESSLECILEWLSPVDLCNVAEVCTSLRHRCRSDALWEKHIKWRWDIVLGDAAYREWDCHVTRIMGESPMLQQNENGLFGSITGVWPLLCLGSYLEISEQLISLVHSNCSKMALYVSLQRGRFWFPAQVYKCARLFCYDALLSYDCITNTFRARSPIVGWQLIKENIQWDRCRISPVDTSPLAFYMSNCLNDLKPGDHIEIQKRRRNEKFYVWHYAVIGHLESCDEDEHHCCCQSSGTLMVEFIQDWPQVQCRKIALNRNLNEEQCISWFVYGGIRKISNKEIEKWNSLYTQAPHRQGF